jgi:hypothetical protein
MAGERIQAFIRQAQRREGNDFRRYHLLWALGYSILTLFPLLFLARFLEFTPPTWAFPLFLLPAFVYLLVRLRGRFPSEEECATKADRVYRLNEQLLTAHEILAQTNLSFLAHMLVERTESRLLGLSPQAWPKRSLRLPILILLIVLFASAALPWLPPCRMLQAGQVTPLLEELAERYSLLPGKDPLTTMELVQARRAIERGDLSEARQLLEQAGMRLSTQTQQDLAGQKALSTDPDLSFLAKGMAGDSSSLHQLEQLSSSEQIRFAQQIQLMMDSLPEGSLKSVLQALVTSLRQNDTALSKRLDDLSALLPEEQALLTSLGRVLTQLGGKSDQSLAGIPGRQSLPSEAPVQPASGIGTQGGISQGEQKPSFPPGQYIKAPPETMMAAGDTGLLYIPQEVPLDAPNGTPLILPQEGSSSFQAGQEINQVSATQPLQDYRTVFPRYQQQAVQQLTRQALPPDMEAMVQRYYQAMEVTP